MLASAARRGACPPAVAEELAPWLEWAPLPPPPLLLGVAP